MKVQGMTVLYAAGTLCLVYFIGIMLSTGLANPFNFAWLLLSGGFFCWALLLRHMHRAGLYLPGPLKAIFLVLFGCGLAVFLLVEVMIAGGFWRGGAPQLPYIIVLGAKVNGTAPSRSLSYRIERAYTYLAENEGTVAILSGGQGKDEGISEAECMRRELVARGISEERLISEAASTNTRENIEYSGALMQGEKAGIVTNGFHVYRAVGIARKQGLSEAVGIAADSELWLLPNHMLREFFAVVKDRLMGNM